MPWEPNGSDTDYPLFVLQEAPGTPQQYIMARARTYVDSAIRRVRSPRLPDDNRPLRLALQELRRRELQAKRDFNLFVEVSTTDEYEQRYFNALPTMWVKRPKGAEMRYRLSSKCCYQETLDRYDTYASTPQLISLTSSYSCSVCRRTTSSTSTT